MDPEAWLSASRLPMALRLGGRIGSTASSVPLSVKLAVRSCSSTKYQNSSPEKARKKQAK
eukprot:6201985-Pleurochrysis_carterae.AAC.2